MTLKTSWFDFGIYKNALRRFKWGSFLYFVILFFAVPFAFMVNDYSYRLNDYYYPAGVKPNMLFETEFTVIPTIVAYAVSVIVAVIMHRYMHDGKQGIAIHSMPVTRRSNYISNLAAGFTLMFAPVILNGIILAIMSLSGYGEMFTPLNVLYWVGNNIEILFFMFSVSTFAAFLTGQWAAHAIITILLHLLPIFVALGIAFFSDVFLYGFVDSHMSAAQVLLRNTPFVWLFPFGKQYMGMSWIQLHINELVYKTVAIALYFGAYFVYKYRKVEACGDVAAFKIVRHVLKYGITALIMLAVSAIGYEAGFGLYTIVILNLVFGAIGYFATEMVLSKSLKVFGKYKGFLAFCVAVVAFVCFFAYTSVFGFETRVPDVEDVKEATIYDYSDCVPYVADEDFIRNVTEIHRQHILEMPVVNPSHYNFEGHNVRSLNISYKLKNGKELIRCYWMSVDDYEAILSKMYENETYKLKAEEVYYLNTEALGGIEFGARVSGAGNVYTYYFSREEAQSIIKAFGEDLKDMSYADIKNANRDLTFRLEIRTRDENNEKISDLILEEAEAYNYVPYSLDYSFNENFTRTVSLIKEWGYYEDIMSVVAENLYIGRVPIDVVYESRNMEAASYKEMIYSYKEDTGYIDEFNVSLSDCVKLSYGDGKMFAETLLKTADRNVEPGTYYAIYWLPEADDIDQTNMGNRISMIEVNKLPDYLKKYVE